MKFAKELEQDLVPEWRAKYLDYKIAKKKLKTVGKAYKRLNTSPKNGLQQTAPSARTPFDVLHHQTTGIANTRSVSQHNVKDAGNGTASPAGLAQRNNGGPELSETAPINIAKTRSRDSTGGRLVRYGSIIGSPTTDSVAQAPSEEGGPAPSLHLPDPALQQTETNASSGLTAQEALATTRTNRSGDSDHVNGTKSSRSTAARDPKRDLPWQQRRTSSSPGILRATLSKRFLSRGGSMTPPSVRSPDVELAAYRDLDFRQAEFFSFLDAELDKIDGFYREKEDEAMCRMKVLREQLHIMRDRRLEDLVRARRSSAKLPPGSHDGESEDGYGAESDRHHRHQKPWQRLVDEAQDITHGGRVGKNSKAMEGLATPSRANVGLDDRRDYARRKAKHEIPYRTAKRKLKIAMQEFYRGLELLKSFALLNRTGFRKINKKYDKTVNARPSYKYMNDKVNKAWFVQSDVIDDLVRTVEDLYARYFERGNHKIAAGKLRAKAANPEEYTGSVFRTGLYVAAGFVFGIEGLVYGAEKLFDPDPVRALNTSYLLQLYGGYFMMLLLVQLFCFACRFWTYSRINYPFVFEFDLRSFLNWRQISELPGFCWLLLGLFMWLNFTDYGAEAMYLYYPVLLIGITLVILLLPLSYIYSSTRTWFLYSNWRLLLAGLYPVEFRDFFLGDMYCSLTYAMGNIELFFCLYARGWSEPTMCNSSHSRLLGFFTTLPGIWRAFQCIRRYVDTRNAFPHLANCAKYLCTILYYMTLSLYRYHRTTELKAVFIVFAAVNAFYCSFWDLVMDWSLMDPYAKHIFLRDTLGFKQIWLYYVAIVLDPILRFNWVFYAIFADDLQHSAVLSFIVSLSEVGRRGLWMLFRVENEHCTNVGRYRASRDVPLPYKLDSSSESLGSEQQSLRSTMEERRESIRPIVSKTSGADIEDGTQGTQASQGTPSQPTGPSLRRRQTPRTPALTPTIRAVGTLLRSAHAQDYAKKKRPGDSEETNADISSDEDDEHDEDEVDRLKSSADIGGLRNMRETDELMRDVRGKDAAGYS